jgi:hypothetical protein
MSVSYFEMIFLYAIKSRDMGPKALVPLRRKACYEYLWSLKSIASAGSEPANLGLKDFVIALLMEAVNASDFGQFLRDYRAQHSRRRPSTRRRENLKSHHIIYYFLRAFAATFSYLWGFIPVLTTPISNEFFKGITCWGIPLQNKGKSLCCELTDPVVT